MKAFEQCFDLLQFTMLYKILVTSVSVSESLVCDHSNERF